MGKNTCPYWVEDSGLTLKTRERKEVRPVFSGLFMVLFSLHLRCIRSGGFLKVRRDIQGLLRLLMSVYTSKPSAFSSKKQVHKPKNPHYLGACGCTHAAVRVWGSEAIWGKSVPLLPSPGG